MSANPKTIGFAAMVLSATLMGFVGLFARNIQTSGDVIAFSRMVVGGLGCFILLMAMGRLQALKEHKLSPAMIFGGMALGTSLAAYVASTQHTSLANAVFLIYTGPLFSPILTAIFLKEKIKPLTAALLACVFVGMLLILGLVNYTPENGLTIGLSFSEETFFGDMLGLASGIGYGFFLFLSRYRTDVPSDVRGFWNFVWGAIGIGIVFVFTAPSVAEMTSSGWVWLAAMATLVGFGALGLLTVAGRHLKAAELSCVAYWECVVGLGLGVVVFSEPMTAIQMLGGVLIIMGGMGEMVIDFVRSTVAKRKTQTSVN